MAAIVSPLMDGSISGKELMEGQMKKLNFENSALLMENKMIKNKYSRASARVTVLEKQLEHAMSEVSDLLNERDRVSSHGDEVVRAQSAREVEHYQMKAAASAKEVLLLKSELKQLEDELCSMRTETEAWKVSNDRSRLHQAHTQERELLQRQVADVKHLLEESERAVELESSRSRELAGQVQQLAQTLETLQRELGGGSEGNVAEKQIAALQMRLQITEERLAQERSDRAGNVSHIEERLLSENAKLQTKAQEVERQLKREKEKTRMLEQKMKELREENLQLRLALSEQEDISYDIPGGRHRWPDQRLPEVNEVLKELDLEGLCEDDYSKDSLLVYLWSDRKVLQQKVKQWDLYLTQLDLTDSGDSLVNLQAAVAISRECEARLEHTEEKCEDISAERIASEQIYKQQLTELVKEKHSTLARLSTMEDLMAALKAENDSLRHALHNTSGNLQAPDSAQEQPQLLQAEVSNREAKLSQLSRKNRALEVELATVQSQMGLRDKELSQALSELSLASCAPAPPHVDDQGLKDQRIRSLVLEVAGLREELSCVTERNKSVQGEKLRLEAELEDVRLQLRSAQRLARDQELSSSRLEKQHIEELEQEVEEKSAELIKLNTQLSAVELSLSTARSELSQQHKTTQDLLTQIETCQKQLQERYHMLDELTTREADQLDQFNLLKDRLHVLTLGLSNKEEEVKLVHLQLHLAQEKITALEEKLGNKSQRSEVNSNLRLSQVEAEKEELNTQLLQAMHASVNFQQQVQSVTMEMNKTKMEATTSLGEKVQIASEKSLLERRIKTLEEEKNLVRTEKMACQVDLGHLEDSLHQVLARLEGETNADNVLLAAEDPSTQKLMNELKKSKVLILAKDKETEMMVQKIRRLDQEKTNLETRCQLLQTELDNNKHDVAMTTKELIIKIKENAATVEVNKMLLQEQSQLQNKLATTDTLLSLEKDRVAKHKSEVKSFIQQIEECEGTQLSTTQALQGKDSCITDLQSQIKKMNFELSKMEEKELEYQTQVASFSQEVKALKESTAVMASRIESKDAELREVQTVSQQRKELSAAGHRLDMLSHDHHLLTQQLNEHKAAEDTLKKELKSGQENEKELKDMIGKVTADLELNKGQLLLAREALQQMKLEKGTLQKDYHEACRRLGEKEQAHAEVIRCKQEEISQVKGENLRLSQHITSQKAHTEQHFLTLSKELEMLKQQLQDKDEEILNYKQSIQRLEQVQSQSKSLELTIHEQSQWMEEKRLLMDSLYKQISDLKLENSQLQDKIAKKVVVILDLQDKLRSSEEVSDRQTTDLRHTIEGMRYNYEYEKKALKDSSAHVEETLKKMADELNKGREVNHSLMEQLQKKDEKLNELNLQIKQFVSSQKIAADKMGLLKETIEDLKAKKLSCEETASSHELATKKMEIELVTVKDQLKGLSLKLQASEVALKTSEERNETIKMELSHHQQMLNSYKHQSSSKFHQLSLDFKQQVESENKEQIKYQQEAHKLSVALEQTRELLAEKNKENLKLQETVLELEEKLGDAERKLKLLQESTQAESQTQLRFQDQESELKKLRNFLAQKSNENLDGKSMWLEMNRVISQLSKQLQFHIETSRPMEHSDSSHLVHKLRKQLLETESELNTERALHQVTRSSMEALEDDCSRLRQTIFTIRKRSAKTDKKQKSRMEEINEIIARSETRAQSLMSSGEFHPDLMASRDYNLGHTSFSTNTPDTSFSSSHLANLSFLNLSSSLYPPPS